MRKRVLHKAMVLILTLSLCLNLMVPASAATVFPDVPASHWAYDEIQKCCSLGIVKGHNDGTFKPEDSVTGAEFATMLTRTFYSAELAANDLLAGEAWYLPALTTAHNAGMLNGTSRLAGGRSSNWSGTADLPLSRYDMAQMLSNVLADKSITMSSDQQNASKSTIKDWSNIPSQYQNAVLRCYALGILRGMEDGSFAGGSTMRRSEACAVINREVSCIGGASPAPTTPSGSSGGETQQVLDFSDSYRSGQYYTALKAVTLTGDYRQDIINIAASQIGYHESSREDQLDGSASGNGNYSEYGRALGSNGSAWCSEFASWCIRQAGVSTDIIRSSRSASVSTFNAPYYSWSQTSYAGGSYTPQPGDLALFAWSGTKLTDPYLSHTAIVSGVKQEGGKVQLSVIHGNVNDAVCRSVYTIDASTGKCSGGQLGYFVSPNYGPSSVQNYDPKQDTQAPAPEPVINLSQTSVTLETGKSSTLTASTDRASAKVTYTSGDPSVARVDQNGRITALKAGITPITASVTVNGRRATAQCVVTVTDPGASAQLKISPETLSLKTGETGSVKATLTGGTAAVSYSSSSQSIASVDASGRVTAKAAGTAAITASATVSGRKLTAVCTVTVTAAQSKTPQQLAGEVVTLVNQERARQGLPALGTLDTLTAAAQVRAPEVARSFSHTRPDGRSFSTVLSEAGVTNYYMAGENIASGQRTPEAVMNSWMNSSGHKANILNKEFTHIGVAYHNGAWVQVFIGSSSSSGSGGPGGTSQPSIPTQGINPGASQAVCSSLPADRITKHYREDWANGDRFEISVSGNTLSFSGRYTASAANRYSHVLLRAFGYHNEASVPFVNGEEFHLQVTIDMDAFTAYWNKDPRPLSIVTAMPVSNYTPGASSFSGVHYRAAGSIRLALDDNNELAVYVGDQPERTIFT